MLLALMGAREVASPDAAATLFNVSVVPANTGAIVAAGGILALVHVLRSPVVAVHMHGSRDAATPTVADESVRVAATILGESRR